MPIGFAAAGCALPVRKLPKRNPRVFGPRRVRFPFVWVFRLLIVVPPAGLFALLIHAFVSGSGTFSGVSLTWSIVGLVFFGSLSLILPLAPVLLGISGADARVRNQTTIEDATKSDARLPVVFLRPFAAEEWHFVGETDDNHPLTFEEYLRPAFWERIGPSVALGNPEDYLPRPFRTYTDDEGWYEYFERLAGQAVCMVMPVSNSDNLQQELTFIRREGLQRRLFILTDLLEVVPRDWLLKPIPWILLQLYGPPRIDQKATWQQLGENLGKLGFDFGDNPGRGAVVTFDSDGNATVLVKGAETPQEFVEPIRKYLARNFGLDLRGTAAGCEGETPKQVGNSSEITDSVAPQPAKASEGKNRKLTSKLASISVKCADRFLGALTV